MAVLKIPVELRQSIGAWQSKVSPDSSIPWAATPHPACAASAVYSSAFLFPTEHPCFSSPPTHNLSSGGYWRSTSRTQSLICQLIPNSGPAESIWVELEKTNTAFEMRLAISQLMEPRGYIKARRGDTTLAISSALVRHLCSRDLMQTHGLRLGEKISKMTWWWWAAEACSWYPTAFHRTSQKLDMVGIWCHAVL